MNNEDKLIKAVAKHLSGWDAIRLNGQSVLSDSKGRIIHVHIDYRGKCEASGSFPRDVDGSLMSASSWMVVEYGQPDPRIGFSPTKSPELIARDIEKRLIPRYIELHIKACKKLKAQQVARDARDAAVDRFIDSCSMKRSMNNEREFYSQHRDDGPTVDGRIRYDGKCVDLNLKEVPLALGVKILKLLNKG